MLTNTLPNSIQIRRIRDDLCALHCELWRYAQRDKVQNLWSLRQLIERTIKELQALTSEQTAPRVQSGDQVA